MYVCVCNAITDKQIRKAAKAGARNLRDLQSKLGVATRCGSCMEVASDILRESRKQTRITEPRIYRPALA
uniref:Bacterioferritin-associated ferredoxin n=1 Tax=uncultured bacterium ws198A12 TaxID=1131830 RepID=I1X5J6_9BACT|nr:protein containing BFD-like [2Fe-2S]-binding region domain [uncultured bacterium ws198A12]